MFIVVNESYDSRHIIITIYIYNSVYKSGVNAFKVIIVIIVVLFLMLRS